MTDTVAPQTASNPDFDEEESEDRSDWHRLMGLLLHPLFQGLGGRTTVEVDLSLQKQLADIITVRRETVADWQWEAWPEIFWRVFDNLQDHNIITFKSYSESFNSFALAELYGHQINYCKVNTIKQVQTVTPAQVGLYAITHHYPRKLLHLFFKQGAVQVVKEDEAYDLRPGGLSPVRIIIVCCTVDNPILGLFADDYQKVSQSYERIKQESSLLDYISTYLNRIREHFGEVIDPMYSKEDFLRENPFPWEEEVLARGREEGREEGQREAMLLNIKRVIALRFEVALDHFAQSLNDLSFAGVQDLNDLVFEVATLAEFEEAVAAAQLQFLARNRS